MTDNKKRIKNDIQKVVKWAESKGFSVVFGRDVDDAMYLDEKEITINTKSKLEKRLYALLHECGHIIQRTNKKTFNKKYPFSSKIEDRSEPRGNLVRSPKYQVDLITEEIDAWRMGKRLAKRLGVTIDNNIFSEETTKWVFTYISDAYCKVAKKKRNR